MFSQKYLSVIWVAFSVAFIIGFLSLAPVAQAQEPVWEQVNIAHTAVSGKISLKAVWGSSADNVYAVGTEFEYEYNDDGILIGYYYDDDIWHYDGQTWSRLNLDSDGAIFYGIWGSSADNVYTVGSNSNIWHYDGQTWSKVNHDLGTTYDNLYGIWGSSADDVYAVGERGFFLHYDGQTWSEVEREGAGGSSLYGIWGSSADDVYVVGEHGIMWHYDGQTWSKVDHDFEKYERDLKEIWGSSATDVYAVGEDGLMLHYDGQTWSLLSGSYDLNLYGIWGSSAADVYAVGDYYDSFGNGHSLLWHYDGQTWSEVNHGLTGPYLNGIWGSSATNIYAVSYNTIWYYTLDDDYPDDDDVIASIKSGDWHDPSTWDKGRVPNSDDVVLVLPGHQLYMPRYVQVKAISNYGTLTTLPEQSLHLKASGVISNYGHILGANGNPGQVGSSLMLISKPFYNEGTIQAGRGGDGQVVGGPGGSVVVLGRDTTNHGTICAGDGGDGSDRGGRGGYAHIWGKYGGPGFLKNDGLLCAGNGGNGETGGDGGTLKVISLPEVILGGGRHYAGTGGEGTFIDGRDGQVIIEPNVISLTGPNTEVKGGDIIIFGGNDWTLDLRNLPSDALQATGHITLAVGSGSVVDLRDNSASVLQADGQLFIAADDIQLDQGVNLADVASVDTIETAPSQILYDVSLVGPEQVTSGMSFQVDILNGGPLQDTYSLDWVDVSGWAVNGLPSSVAVEGLTSHSLMLDIVPAAEAEAGATNVITVTAVSQADPMQQSVLTIEATVGYQTFLPIILK